MNPFLIFYSVVLLIQITFVIIFLSNKEYIASMGWLSAGIYNLGNIIRILQGE